MPTFVGLGKGFAQDYFFLDIYVFFQHFREKIVGTPHIIFLSGDTQLVRVLQCLIRKLLFMQWRVARNIIVLFLNTSSV